MILDHEAAVSCDAHPPYSPPPPYDDDEYDVYLFWPSSYPHVLVPVEFGSHRVFEVAPPAVPDPTAVPNTCQLPPAYTDSDALSEDEIPDAPSFFRVRAFSLTHFSPSRHSLRECTQPSSPTFSFLSDFVFPESASDDMEVAGYSRLFRSGLTCTSRQITRQFDVVYRQLRRALRSSWWQRPS